MLKKTILIILGVFLSLLILECGLRLAGFTIYHYQQYKNSKTLKNKSQYTIMCLGESTTEGQYPIQLQQILNKKYPNKFSVIDCGIPDTRLITILNQIDININKYSPNIAICMMGINDDRDFILKRTIKHKALYFYNFKIYKLCVLIKNALIKKYYLNTQNKNELLNCFYNAKRSGNYKEAKKIIKFLVSKNPKDKNLFIILAEFYEFNLRGNYEIIGYNMAKKAIDEKFIERRPISYNIVFSYCLQKKDIQTLKKYIQKSISEDIDIFRTYLKHKLYSHIKNFITDEQKKQILSIINNDSNNISYAFDDIISIERKDYKKTEEYFEKAEGLRLKYPNLEAYKLYKLIIKKLITRNIKVICMQYPIRSIKPLQEQLKKEFYYNKLSLVSNEQYFKNILKSKKYNEIFCDQFAGDFGHCTDLGNTMIAENVVETLENILDLK